ncbi:hypothetical protein GOB98_10525 [Sinorhizobium meliloti]|nr:hypothetical protein [Sinorhizobium meliloti]MDW9976524.1 hypothetical protein [Sinorhizobium meliloti]MDX0293246.1 hypothetical protein [Sinorhizobium meliloti]
MSIASEGIAGEIVFGAISIELTARLAITIREVMGRHDAAEDVETKRKIVEDVGPKLLAVSKKLEALTPSAQGLTELLRLSQKSDYATRLSLTLPILRDSFASQRSRLLARCSSLEAAASTYFAENAPAYFPREFGLCVPGNYSWVPFVLDRQSVTVGTRLAEVPNVLRPFFSVEPAPIPTDSGSITNDGLIIQEVGRQASEQMSANREFLSGLLAGKLAPAVLKLGGVGGTVSEKLSRLNNDLAILGGLDRESHTRAE